MQVWSFLHYLTATFELLVMMLIALGRGKQDSHNMECE